LGTANDVEVAVAVAVAVEERAMAAGEAATPEAAAIIAHAIAKGNFATTRG
jgi:hypothetical protein